MRSILILLFAVSLIVIPAGCGNDLQPAAEISAPAEIETEPETEPETEAEPLPEPPTGMIAGERVTVDGMLLPGGSVYMDAVAYVLCYPTGRYNADTLELVDDYYNFGLKMNGNDYFTHERVYEIERWYVSRYTDLWAFGDMVE